MAQPIRNWKDHWLDFSTETFMSQIDIRSVIGDFLLEKHYRTFGIKITDRRIGGIERLLRTRCRVDRFEYETARKKWLYLVDGRMIFTDSPPAWLESITRRT
jgi:hypothetical protein